jgi:hypothetical protein
MRSSPNLSRVFALIAALATVPAAASAEEAAGPKSSVGYLDLQSTAVPVIWQGRLVNYIFVKARLTLAPAVNSADYRSKLPYVRDALVRESHRTPLYPPGQFSRLDEGAFKRVVFAGAGRFMGPGVVTAITVTSQSPARITGLPSRSPPKRTLIP